MDLISGDTPEKEHHKEEVKHNIYTPIHAKPEATISISKNTLLYLIAIAMLVIGLGAGYVLGARYDGIFGTTGGGTQDQATGAILGTEKVNVAIDDTDPVLGEAKAPITMIEFSDFQCPYCSRFAIQVEPQLIANYVNTGKLKMSFRDFPLPFHSSAMPAAIAADCANEQGKFWEFHDKLFENQQNLSDASYQTWASDLKLDMDKFNSCLVANETSAEVSQDRTDGAAAGVQGTPTSFLITEKTAKNDAPTKAAVEALRNSVADNMKDYFKFYYSEDGKQIIVRLVGAQPVEAFSAVIEAESSK